MTKIDYQFFFLFPPSFWIESFMSENCHQILENTFLINHYILETYMVKRQQDCQWCTPFHSTRTLPGHIPYPQNVRQFHGTCINSISLMSIRKLLPSYCRFSCNSQMLNVIVCRSLYTELNPYQAVDVGSMGRNPCMTWSKVWHPLCQFSRNSKLLNSIMWRFILNITHISHEIWELRVEVCWCP